MKSATFATLVLAGVLPLAASAQTTEAKFWLKQDPKNITGCIRADSSMTREHTFKLANGVAEVKSAGGIEVKMKPIRPNVYEGSFNLSQMDLTYTADLASTPPSLKVSTREGGCKWTAVRE